MKNKHVVAKKKPKNTLRLPDLDQAKSSVLNSLPSKESQRGIGMPSRSSLLGTARTAAFAQQGSSNPLSNSPGITPACAGYDQRKARGGSARVRSG